jgi:hypothetical protein
MMVNFPSVPEFPVYGFPGLAHSPTYRISLSIVRRYTPLV